MPWVRSQGPADRINIGGIVFQYVTDYRSKENAQVVAEGIREDGLKARVRKWVSTLETLYVVYEEVV